MELTNNKIKISTLLKIVSVILIASAISLELWNIYLVLNNSHIPSILNPILGIERLAIAIHLVEGIIAAYYAASREENPIKYGTYTFFVGTIGLVELFKKPG